MRIGIDLDLCVLASDKGWYEWLQNMCGGALKDTTYEQFLLEYEAEGEMVDYNLATYFPTPLNANTSPFDYWRSISVYDTVKPVQGAVEVVTELYNMGHDIVFITHVKGYSSKSKYQWLKRNFDFPFAYVITKEKFLVAIDVMIDDRVDNLQAFPDNVDTILFSTPYKQNPVCDLYQGKVMDWEDIFQYMETTYDLD